MIYGHSVSVYKTDNIPADKYDIHEIQQPQDKSCWPRGDIWPPCKDVSQCPSPRADYRPIQ